MTPQEFKEKMEQLSKLDTERRHIAMDDALYEHLTERSE